MGEGAEARGVDGVRTGRVHAEALAGNGIGERYTYTATGKRLWEFFVAHTACAGRGAGAAQSMNMGACKSVWDDF